MALPRYNPADVSPRRALGRRGGTSTPTAWAGETALRLAFVNPDTETAKVTAVLDAIAAWTPPATP